MVYPDKYIVKFIKQQNVLHLATAVNNIPYSASCYYVYLETENIFVFASKDHTRHIQNVHINKAVSFTISLHTRIIGKIKGIQALGTVEETNNETVDILYKKTYPLSLFIPYKLWLIKPHYIKMTDNTLGFGKKIIWEI